MKAVVVLGKRLLDDGTMTEELAARLNRGLQVFYEEAADYLIVSGGQANKTAGVAEATVMRKYLLEAGVPDQKLIAEENSLTTKQNAAFTIPILKSLGVTRLVICTSNVHLQRRFLNPVKLFRKANRGYNLEISTAACQFEAKAYR